jgi:hypothetical protein
MGMCPDVVSERDRETVGCRKETSSLRLRPGLPVPTSVFSVTSVRLSSEKASSTTIWR